jgi:hypothetical protein
MLGVGTKAEAERLANKLSHMTLFRAGYYTTSGKKQNSIISGKITRP